MAQIVVRNLDDDVKERLKQRARHHGRSLEEELRDILRRAAHEPVRGAASLGSRIARRFRRIGLESPIEELRGQPAKAAKLGR